jgi:hydroxyacylglutathione hydrolase
MFFRQISDERLAQNAYLIGCQATGEAIVIDPERDIDTYIAAAEKEGFDIVAAADTHIHADYLSGLREFADRGVRVIASDEGDDDWKYEWLKNNPYKHRLVYDGDIFTVGNIQFEVVHSPGHTPEHISFLVTDLGGGADLPMGLASGDFVFVGDLGRPDLLESAAGVEGAMEPSARRLYASVMDFMKLQDHIQIWPAHGAGSACGKALGAIPVSTVGYEKAFNASIQAALRGEDEFVAAILDGQPEPPMYFARMKRDNRLGPPLLRTLPQPHMLSFEELSGLSKRKDIVVLDTRLDRGAFMASHLPGSLYAPLNKSFNTVAGSYVDEETDIILVVVRECLDEAIRDLIRIGLDSVVGYTTPEALEQYADRGGKLATIRHEALEYAETVEPGEDIVLLDVRGKAEYEASHVRGAFNIAHTRLFLRRGEVPWAGTIAVYCRTGARSAVAAALLAHLGHEVIYLEGDFDQWRIGRDNIANKASAG